MGGARAPPHRLGPGMGQVCHLDFDRGIKARGIIPVNKRRMGFFYKCNANLEKGFFITPKIAENYGNRHKATGYMHICLQKHDGTWVTENVHRAIWQEANHMLIPKGMVIHHLDGVKIWNGISNLSCCSQYFNLSQVKKFNRDYKKIYELRKRNGFKQAIIATSGKFSKEFPSITQCGKALGIWPSRISNILNKKRYCYTATSKLDGRKYTFVRNKNDAKPEAVGVQCVEQPSELVETPTTAGTPGTPTAQRKDS